MILDLKSLISLHHIKKNLQLTNIVITEDSKLQRFQPMWECHVAESPLQCYRCAH